MYRQTAAHLYRTARFQDARALLIGFDWGVSSEGSHEPQREMPTRTFEQLFEQRELGSLVRVIPYLIRHLPHVELSEIGQTNFCFFRSKTKDQITEEDIKLSTPLFLNCWKLHSRPASSASRHDYGTTSADYPARSSADH